MFCAAFHTDGRSMKAVVQRVLSAQLSVGGALVSKIGQGLVVYLGVASGDGEENAAAMAKKLAALRIFSDAAGKMNKSVQDIAGEVLLVSQFTLCGDCSHGNRPSFTEAARPEIAEPLYRRVAALLAESGVSVRTGVFGADMRIVQENDGPVTIIYTC